MSVVQTAPTALTPPSSSHGTLEDLWAFPTAGGQNDENSAKEEKATATYESLSRFPLAAQSGNPMAAAHLKQFSKPDHGAFALSTTPSGIPADFHAHYGNEELNDRLEKRLAPDPPAEESVDVNSKWIHRDKLARIESEELQAAGFSLPALASPIPRSRHSRASTLNGYKKSTDSPQPGESAIAPSSTLTKPKNASLFADPKLDDTRTSAFDFRLPEEIAAEGLNNNHGTLNGIRGSRIPIPKLSTMPIALERGSGEADFDSIFVPKSRPGSAGNRLLQEPNSQATAFTTSPPATPHSAKRSLSDLSLKKAQDTPPSGSTRKASASTKITSTTVTTISVGSTSPPSTSTTPHWPRVRSSANKDTGSAGSNRTSTRASDHSIGGTRSPEGEPPWMVSAYKPDPRLPPDQQLLPTVARRLQQEKWEREGKFGTIYDKEFRPLTADGFPEKPPAVKAIDAAAATAADPGLDVRPDDWPLKTEFRSPPIRIHSSYSPIPKIQDRPPAMAPHPSPIGAHPLPPFPSPFPSPLQSPAQRVPPFGLAKANDAPEVARDRGESCLCCVVM